MTKQIQIDSPWGRYLLPLRIVVEDRAKYYTDIEFDDEPDPERDEYYEALLVEYMGKDNEFENIDWLQSSMSWGQVKKFTKQIDTKPHCSTEEFWDHWETITILEVDDTGQMALDFTTDTNTIL